MDSDIIASQHKFSEANCDLVESDTDIAALWDRFKDRFPQEVRSVLEEDFPRAETFLGLDHENLINYLSTD